MENENKLNEAELTATLESKVLFYRGEKDNECDICRELFYEDEIKWDNNNKCYACHDCNTDYK
jgi:hypothetical protein